jgi:hypothetical protein
MNPAARIMTLEVPACRLNLDGARRAYRFGAPRLA